MTLIKYFLSFCPLTYGENVDRKTVKCRQEDSVSCSIKWEDILGKPHRTGDTGSLNDELQALPAKLIKRIDDLVPRKWLGWRKLNTKTKTMASFFSHFHKVFTAYIGMDLKADEPQHALSTSFVMELSDPITMDIQTYEPTWGVKPLADVSAIA